jgi:hypothetical protein
VLHTAESWRDILADLGWHATGDVLDDDAILVWRDIPERTNGVIDTPRGRLHVKRTKPPFGREAWDEAEGLRLLDEAGVAAPEAVAWTGPDVERGVLAVADLPDHTPTDVLLADGEIAFADVAESTADMAAQLHAAGLHHRDLYLNHFFHGPDLRLIDAARVRKLPTATGWRWLVKDLAQFRYSAAMFADEIQLDAWLMRWHERFYTARPDAWRWPTGGLRRAVTRKAARIAIHDTKLVARQPHRHVPLHQKVGPAPTPAAAG